MPNSIITPQVLDAIAQVESNYNPNAVSPAGARGVYQFLPIGWQDVQQNYPDFAEYDYDKFVTNPTISKMFAQKLLELNTKRLKDRATLENILASYNFGIGNVLNNKPLPEETQQYVAKIKNILNKPKKQTTIGR